MLVPLKHYLERRLGPRWNVEIWDQGALKGIGVTCYLDWNKIVAARNPAAFLESLEPDVKALASVATHKEKYRPTGPYASRVLLRKKVGL